MIKDEMRNESKTEHQRVMSSPVHGSPNKDYGFMYAPEEGIGTSITSKLIRNLIQYTQ